jgi:hypothetical protein
MKKLIALIFTGLLFVACSTDDTANVSSITYFPLVTLKGSDPVVVKPLGSAYSDPGAIATENGVAIPYTTTATGKYRGTSTLDTKVMDEYSQTYTAVNKDGFSASKVRKVIVYQNGDLTTSIEGLYTSTVKRNGAFMSAAQGSSKDMKYVYIWKNANGTFQVSDAFGGWYNLGRNIAGSFTPGGLFTAAFVPTGNTLVNPYFGGTAVIKSLSVNAATKTLVMTTEWQADATTKYVFECTLVQTTL